LSRLRFNYAARRESKARQMEKGPIIHTGFLWNNPVNWLASLGRFQNQNDVACRVPGENVDHAPQV
jgi:hypothetical protein